MAKLCLVLDMDATLVGDNGLARPYLYPFLLWCFRKAEAVSLWTAAASCWLRTVQDKTLTDVLKRVSKELGRECGFFATYTRDSCRTRVRRSGNYGRVCTVYEKPLRKLWRRAGPYTRHNTIIVDDKSLNFDCNYGNGIWIPPYTGPRPDEVLLDLIIFLYKLTTVLRSEGTILHTEKRKWYEERY